MESEFLDPKTTVFEMSPDGTLRVIVPEQRCGLRVEAMCAFPLSHPREYIVLRDGSEKEIGVVRNLEELPEASAVLVREQLHRRYFLPRITQIYSITERFGSSVWELETDRGRCSVTTKQMNEAVAEIESGRYIITDVEGNRYEVQSLNDLDRDSRARFQGKY